MRIVQWRFEYLSKKCFLLNIRIFGSNFTILRVLQLDIEKRNAKGTRVLISVVAFLSRSFLKIKNAFLSRSSLSGTRSGTRSFMNAFLQCLAENITLFSIFQNPRICPRYFWFSNDCHCFCKVLQNSQWRK